MTLIRISAALFLFLALPALFASAADPAPAEPTMASAPPAATPVDDDYWLLEERILFRIENPLPDGECELKWTALCEDAMTLDHISFYGTDDALGQVAVSYWLGDDCWMRAVSCVSSDGSREELHERAALPEELARVQAIVNGPLKNYPPSVTPAAEGE